MTTKLVAELDNLLRGIEEATPIEERNIATWTMFLAEAMELFKARRDRLAIVVERSKGSSA